MKRRDPGSAFTLIGLLMVIAIIACLAALPMPALTVVRQKADGIACMSNLRQIGISGQFYVAENSQTTPVIEPWPSQPVELPSRYARAASTAGGKLSATSPSTRRVTQASVSCSVTPRLMIMYGAPR